MVWTALHGKIHHTIRCRKLFKHHQRLLVAVSGGQDSLCVTKLLLDLQSKWGWHLGIAHCDHRWRSDSQANAAHVEALANGWGLYFYLSTAATELNSEAAARDWRYWALSRIAEEHNYEYVVTGHTASDRAETLLYNLIRGTGADGLQALTWQRQLGDIWVVRPLLGITRKQTGEFCRQFDLPIWQDSTNEDVRYARNRIRQQLIPYLQANFNPQVESALAQTAELLQAEVEYLETLAAKLKQEVMERCENGVSRLNRSILQSVPLALQRRVMRQVLQEILIESPGFEHIEKLTALIIAPNRSQTDPFPGGAIAQVQGDWIYII